MTHFNAEDQFNNSNFHSVEDQVFYWDSTFDHWIEDELSLEIELIGQVKLTTPSNSMNEDDYWFQKIYNIVPLRFKKIGESHRQMHHSPITHPMSEEWEQSEIGDILQWTRNNEDQIEEITGSEIQRYTSEEIQNEKSIYKNQNESISRMSSYEYFTPMISNNATPSTSYESLDFRIAQIPQSLESMEESSLKNASLSQVEAEYNQALLTLQKLMEAIEFVNNPTISEFQLNSLMSKNVITKNFGTQTENSGASPNSNLYEIKDFVAVEVIKASSSTIIIDPPPTWPILASKSNSKC